MFYLVLFIIIIVLARMSYSYSRKCPKCKKWNSLIKINEKYSRTKTEQRTETLNHKSANGQPYSRQVKGPHEIEFYNVKFRCKKCNSIINAELEDGQLSSGYIWILIIGFIIIAIIAIVRFNSNNSTLNQNKKNNDSIIVSSKQNDLKSNSVKQVNSNERKDSTSQNINENIQVQKAIEMIKQDKDIAEIAESTMLTKKQIRKLRRELKKTE